MYYVNCDSNGEYASAIGINPFFIGEWKPVNFFNKESNSHDGSNVKWNDIDKIKQLNIIESFANLKNNWDSYGAAKTSKNAIQLAKNFISHIPNSIVFDIYPTANGSIQLEINRDNDYLELEILDGNKIELFSEKDKKIVEKKFLIHDGGDFNSLLRMVEEF